MAKKPFSIRVDTSISTRFKALHTILKIDAEKMLSELISDRELKLSPSQEKAYRALLEVWNDELSN